DGFGQGGGWRGRRGGNPGSFGINGGTRGGGEPDGQFGGEGRPCLRPVRYGRRPGRRQGAAGQRVAFRAGRAGVGDPDRQAGEGGVGDGDGDEAGPGDLGLGDPQLVGEPGGEPRGGFTRVAGVETERQAGRITARPRTRPQPRLGVLAADRGSDRAPQPRGDQLG